MHRSGTTFLGEAVRRFDGLDLIHEPLNPQYGLAGVRHVYPCDIIPEQENYYFDLLHELEKGRGKFVCHVDTDGFAKGILRSMVGGRAGLGMSVHQLRSLVPFSERAILYKDPFQSMLLAGALKRGYKCIVLVRHPVAIWQSLSRMGWTLDLRRLGIYDQLKKLNKIPDASQLSSLSELERFAILWSTIYEYVMALDDCPDLLILKHETFCTSPFDVVDSISTRFELSGTERVKRMLENRMFSNTVTVKDRKLHSLSRNSLALATSWVGTIDPATESLIQQYTGSLVDRIYGGWYPI